MGIAIITGASSGIGAQFARELKRSEGITEFWFVARREERMRSLAEELGVSARIIEADLATDGGVEKLRATLAEHRPSVKYLVNAAGFGSFGIYSELEDQEVASMIDLNVKALVLITHMVLPYMERGGRIIELGSGSSFTPLPAFNVYASSKAFVLHYTKALNYEIRHLGLRATCFCPGWVKTEFIGKATAGERTEPKKFSPLLDCERVVRGCVRAARRGKAMYVVGLYTKLQHLLFKLLPDCILSRLWCGMLNRRL